MPRVAKKKSLVIEVPEDAVSGGASVRKKMSKPSPTVSVMGFLLFLALGAAGYFYYQYTNTTQVAEAREIRTLAKKIGAVIALPQEETPTLATVTNKDKLDNQPFFQKAKNGDKILIYSTAGQVVLYRPATGKVIDMTTVTVATEPAPETALATPDPASEAVEVPPVEEPIEEAPVEPVDVTTLPATIALYNGSSRVGVTNTFETELLKAYPLVTVAAKEKAVKNDYQGVSVIDLSGTYVALAEGLAASFAGTVATLPDGETAPEADILIIVGNK
jgi:hypothetical protein